MTTSELVLDRGPSRVLARTREIEDVGDFLVAELLIASQNQGHALALRELCDRLFDRLLEFTFQK